MTNPIYLKYRVQTVNVHTKEVTLMGYFRNIFDAMKYGHGLKLYPCEVLLIARNDGDGEDDKWFIVYSRHGRGR